MSFIGEDGIDDGACHLFAMGSIEYFFGIVAVGHEATLDKDARHWGFIEDYETSTAHAAVIELEGPDDGFLGFVGEEDALVVEPIGGFWQLLGAAAVG